jgi:hypothetical protein
MTQISQETLQRINKRAYQAVHDFMQCLEKEGIIKPGWALHSHETVQKHTMTIDDLVSAITELRWLGILKPGWELTFPYAAPTAALLPEIPMTENNWDHLLPKDNKPQ